MEINVPNVKQTFNIEYRYYANNTIVHCIILLQSILLNI